MLNILFIGSLGDQSLITLDGLLKSGHTVRVVALAGSTLGLGNTPSLRGRFIPAINPDSTKSILNTAMESGIPIEILYPGVIPNRLQLSNLDVGIVSCYPHRLQDELLALPKFGCFNLHPSLLPQYRGPAPLFWQLLHGITHTGVTLHRMDKRFDSGYILSQERIAIRDGISEAELSRLCATRGSALINNALQQLELGTLVSTPQDDQLASYHGWPMEKDFHIDIDWDAHQISNFIQGTRQRGRAYDLRIGEQLFMIDSVADISHNHMRDKDYSVEGKYLRFNCYDGYVTARLAD